MMEGSISLQTRSRYSAILHGNHPQPPVLVVLPYNGQQQPPICVGTESPIISVLQNPDAKQDTA